MGWRPGKNLKDLAEKIIDNRAENRRHKIDAKYGAMQHEDELNAQLSAMGKETIGKTGRQRMFGENMKQGSMGFLDTVKGFFGANKTAGTNKYGAIAIAAGLGIIVLIALLFRKKRRK